MNCFYNFLKAALRKQLDPNLDVHREKQLDPDPQKMNADPQPWKKNLPESELECEKGTEPLDRPAADASPALAAAASSADSLRPLYSGEVESATAVQSPVGWSRPKV